MGKKLALYNSEGYIKTEDFDVIQSLMSKCDVEHKQNIPDLIQKNSLHEEGKPPRIFWETYGLFRFGDTEADMLEVRYYTVH